MVSRTRCVSCGKPFCPPPQKGMSVPDHECAVCRGVCVYCGANLKDGQKHDIDCKYAIYQGSHLV